jgi:hypothetical protein
MINCNNEFKTYDRFFDRILNQIEPKGLIHKSRHVIVQINQLQMKVSLNSMLSIVDHENQFVRVEHFPIKLFVLDCGRKKQKRFGLVKVCF